MNRNKFFQIYQALLIFACDFAFTFLRYGIKLLESTFNMLFAVTHKYKSLLLQQNRSCKYDIFNSIDIFPDYDDNEVAFL